jgi:hypothetical protein
METIQFLWRVTAVTASNPWLVPHGNRSQHRDTAKELAQAVALLTCIHDVMGLNLGRDIRYVD